MDAVLNYPGAKNRLAPWICSFIPEHSVYVEPFFGSGAVFFNKKPVRKETLNDLDGNVVNFFRVLRDNPEELFYLLSLTPYARDEYCASYIEGESDSDVEKARKFAVKCWMGFGCGTLYRNGFSTSQTGNGSNHTKIWKELPERLQMASERLRDAQIENLPAVELIRRYNNSSTFLYIDPPYLRGIRKKYLYRYEMEDEEHMELLELLNSHSGKIMISGYESELYDEYLKGWHKESIPTRAERGVKRIETIWMNYDMEQISLVLK